MDSSRVPDFGRKHLQQRAFHPYEHIDIYVTQPPACSHGHDCPQDEGQLVAEQNLVGRDLLLDQLPHLGARQQAHVHIANIQLQAQTTSLQDLSPSGDKHSHHKTEGMTRPPSPGMVLFLMSRIKCRVQCAALLAY